MSEHFEVIDLLSKFENLVGDLYACFAKSFPEHSKFWKAIADEERDHSQLLINIKKKVAEGHVEFNERIITKQNVTAAIEGLKKQKERAGNNEIDLAEAIALAKGIESMVIEKNIYEFFKTERQDINEVLTALIEDTEDHFKRLEEFEKG